uniref:Uncharacterized protein n=1 Tax=Tetraselmis sp. GSL018 TaxID=582737 RepID=A0A061SBT6_9CHLO
MSSSSEGFTRLSEFDTWRLMALSSLKISCEARREDLNSQLGRTSLQQDLCPSNSASWNCAFPYSSVNKERLGSQQTTLESGGTRTSKYPIFDNQGLVSCIDSGLSTNFGSRPRQSYFTWKRVTPSDGSPVATPTSVQYVKKIRKETTR